MDFLGVLSNGDLIAHLGISNGNIGSSNFQLNCNYFLTRIDQETGKIIWASAHFFNDIGSQAIPYNFAIKNDTIWMIAYIQNYITPSVDTYGIILKYNAGGDLEDSYVVPSIQLNYALQCQSASFFDDGSYVATWNSRSEKSGFSVSSASSQ